MKVTNQNDMPRERALQKGVESLDNRSLLALLLQSGTKYMDVFEMADTLLKQLHGVEGLYTCTYAQLIQVKGIHKAKALKLLACIELSKRMITCEIRQGEEFHSPQKISTYFNQKIGFKQQEHFAIALLDVKNKLIFDTVLFIGTINCSVVHSRDVFKLAIQYNAYSFIIVHNHPSGDCIPSEQDIALTSNLHKASSLMNIKLLDHVIVSKNQYFSFKENQLL